MAPTEWASAAPVVPEYDYSQPADVQRIKSHNAFENGPIVIRNAVTADGPLEALVRFGDVNNLRQDLQASTKFSSPAGPKDTMRFGVKMASKRFFSYWDDESSWLGKEMKEKSKKRREWHRWRKKPLKIKYFFDHYEKKGAPYLYWQGNLEPSSIGMDPRPTLCHLFSASFDETACKENWHEGETSAWLNSAGVLAGAHFDVNQNINVQLKGRKKWTLWAPHQLNDLCFYPYIHPSTRQVQADLTGDGVGANCPTARGMTNLTVVVEPGDVLIVPPFYVHRVETLDASINFNIWWEATESRAHTIIGTELAHAATGVVNQKTYPQLHRECLPDGQQCKKSEVDVAKPRATASAALRLIVKRITTGLIGAKKDKVAAFLKLTWETDYAQLPDIELLSSGGDVAQLCSDEIELIGAKRRHMLIARADGVVAKFKQLRGKWHDGAHDGGESRWKSSGMPVDMEREELRFVVGALLAVAHGNMEVMFIVR